jgi:hypothetical protein
VTRRRLLTFGLGGAVLLACGGGLGWVTAGYRVDPGDVPIGLSIKELAVVRAIVEALLPADGDLPGGLALGVHQRIDEEVWAAPDPVRSDLKSAIVLIEHLPPLLGFPGRFSRLAPDEREACLRAMLLAGPTPVVQAAVALKQMCSLFYYSRAETWGALGYDGPWVPEKPPESAVRYRERVQAARESA